MSHHEHNFWELGCMKGDTNGDGYLNTFDIDPFVLMLTNPAAYCAAYPGVCLYLRLAQR